MKRIDRVRTYLGICILIQVIPGVAFSQEIEFARLLEQEELTEEQAEEKALGIQELAFQPVDIHSDRVSELSEKGLITPLQLNKLREYLLMYGKILSIHELRLIDGWDENTFLKIEPYIALSPVGQYQPENRKWKPGIRQELLLGTFRVLERSQGYLPNGEDNAVAAAEYSGSAWRIGLRYSLQAGKHLLAGIRAEKDPGEELLPYHDEYPLKMNYPDYLSGYVVIRDIKFIRSLCLGDYQIRFGKGITLSTGQSFNSWKSPFVTGSAYSRIRQHSSLAESGHFRGAALQTSLGNFSLHMFFSSRKADPSGLDIDSTEMTTFTAFNESGYHRTATERSRRGLVDERTAGAMLNFSNRWMHAGLAGYRTLLSVDMAPSRSTYARFGATGKKFDTAGGFIELWVRKSMAFLEVCLSDSLQTAVVAGFHTLLAPGIRFCIDFRHFPVGFSAGLHSGGWGPYGSRSGETGLGLGLEVGLPKRWVLKVVADVCENSWLRYRVDFPGKRNSLFLGLQHTTSATSFLLGYTYRQADENFSSRFSYLGPVIHWMKHQLDMQYTVHLSEYLRYKSKVSYILLDEGFSGKQDGIMFQQEMVYQMPEGRIRVCAGGILFHTGGYGTRLYAYEQDILYSGGSQSLYGRGVRSYILLKWSPIPLLDLWFKAGRTWFDDAFETGSGSDAISGDRKTAISAQVRLRM